MRPERVRPSDAARRALGTQPDDEPLRAQLREELAQRLERLDRPHPARAPAQIAFALRAAQKQLADDRELDGVQLELAAEILAPAVDAAALRDDARREPLLREGRERS